MAHRHSTTALLIGLIVGTLLGAGVLQCATVTADTLLSATDDNYRSARFNSQQEGVELRNDGMAGVRREEPAGATDHSAATLAESARSCNRKYTGDARAACLQDLLDNYVRGSQ